MPQLTKKKGKGRGKGRIEESQPKSPAAAVPETPETQAAQVIPASEPLPSQASSSQASSSQASTSQPLMTEDIEESQVFGRTSPPAVAHTSSSEGEAVPGEASPVLQTAQKKKKKSSGPSASQSQEDLLYTRRAEKVVLTEEVEEELSEWLRENPMLYDKASPGYNLVNKKEMLWEEKARSLDPPLDKAQLKRWYQTTRTAMSRAKKMRPSGSGAQPLTQRQRFQQRVFSWLTPFIREVPGRQIHPAELSRRLGVKSSAPQTEEEILEVTPPVSDPEEDAPPSRPSSALDVSVATSQGKRRRKTSSFDLTGTPPSAAPVPDVQDFMANVTSALAQLSQSSPSSHLQVPRSPQAALRKSWVEGTITDLLDCPYPDLWLEFQSAFFQCAANFNHKLHQRQQAEKKQQEAEKKQRDDTEFRRLQQQMLQPLHPAFYRSQTPDFLSTPTSSQASQSMPPPSQPFSQPPSQMSSLSSQLFQPTLSSSPLKAPQLSTGFYGLPPLSQQPPNYPAPSPAPSATGSASQAASSYTRQPQMPSPSPSLLFLEDMSPYSLSTPAIPWPHTPGPMSPAGASAVAGPSSSAASTTSSSI